MADEVKLEVGYGLGTGDNAFASGVETARQALGCIRECAVSLVLVFASSRYDLKELLRGVHSVVGEVPVVGATTAGEICNGPHHDSIVVTILASPYLEVSVGLGQGVSKNWHQAVVQAVSTPGIAPLFSPDDNTAWSELTLQGKSAFAFMFAPGETFTSMLRSFEILEEVKRLSQDRLPVIGGAAGDDLRMETNYVFYGEQAYPDSLLLVICRTQLRFGIAMAHGLKPTAQRVMVSRSHNHEVLELDGQTAAEVYSNTLGHSRESLEGQHLTLVTGRPMGTLDPYGQYSINVAAYFTPNGGLRVAQPVTEGTMLTFMVATPGSVAAAGREALRKALLRGSITQVATVLVFSCCLRACFLGDRLVEEIQGMQQILPEVPYTGFYSMGEQGVADDGVNRNNTEVIAVLVLGRELSYAAKVALEREGLRREVEQAEALKVAYAALEREIVGHKKAEEQIIRQREELRGLAARLAEVEELERQKLAGEIHDEVCQNLANIGMTLEILKLKASHEPLDWWLSRLAAASELVEQTGETTRNIMEGLRPTVLDHYGLVGGLRQLGKQFSQRTGTDLEVLGEETDCRLKPEVELALFRIAQEALNNVAKHARASRVVVTEKVDQDTVSLIIADNGIGFDPNLVSNPNEARGWGLVIMHERAKAVGGTCHIESQPGLGTRLTVEVSR
jgi:signal transduction histidine kinase